MKIRESTLIFLLVLSAVAANVVAPTRSELEAMYAAASGELNAGHYDEALQKLDAIDARQPDLAQAQNLRGVALLRLGDYGRAEVALRKARELDPELWETRFNLAEVPFLKKDWPEARRRFKALAAEPNDQVQGATSDLIQFKILLTFVLEGKEKMGAEILERLKTSRESPALYYAQAALALRHENQKDAKAWMTTAEKEFSPQLNKLFAESFYEVGWKQKPGGAIAAALEVTSKAERAARVQADFGKAERAFRQRDFEGALQSLDQVDATAPNQAASYNLRGAILLEQGNYDAAERALRAALAADPQFEEARYNLARVPFQRKDYETSRRELEALLGATSGGRQQKQKEQLIRFEIFLTLLLEGRESAAQKALDEFKMMDDTPALYYAQAAWAFQHGNPKQGSHWVANAGNLYSAELNRSFAASFAALGWLNNAEAPPTPTTGALVKADASPRAAPAQARSSIEFRTSPAPVVVENAPAKPAATANPTTTPFAPAEEAPAPVSAKADVADATPSPAPTPEAAATPGEIASAKKKRTRESEASSRPAEKQRTARSKSKPEDATQSKPLSARSGAAESPAAPSPTEASEQRPHQNLGDKVARLLFYPFKQRREKTASPPPNEPVRAESATGQSSPPEQYRPRN